MLWLSQMYNTMGRWKKLLWCQDKCNFIKYYQVAIFCDEAEPIGEGQHGATWWPRLPLVRTQYSPLIGQYSQYSPPIGPHTMCCSDNSGDKWPVSADSGSDKNITRGNVVIWLFLSCWLILPWLTSSNSTSKSQTEKCYKSPKVRNRKNNNFNKGCHNNQLIIHMIWHSSQHGLRAWTL